MRVVVGSPAGSFALNRPGGDGTMSAVHVEIAAGSGLTATRTVQLLGGSGLDGLASFFDALAQGWRGWRGTRVWQSLEGELSIAALHDGLVRLDVQLRGPSDHDWFARCDVLLEPGEQLAAASLGVRALAAMYDSGT